MEGKVKEICMYHAGEFSARDPRLSKVVGAYRTRDQQVGVAGPSKARTIGSSEQPVPGPTISVPAGSTEGTPEGSNRYSS